MEKLNSCRNAGLTLKNINEVVNQAEANIVKALTVDRNCLVKEEKKV